jgi:hypothetical protein
VTVLGALACRTAAGGVYIGQPTEVRALESQAGNGPGAATAVDAFDLVVESAERPTDN